MIEPLAAAASAEQPPPPPRRRQEKGKNGTGFPPSFFPFLGVAMEDSRKISPFSLSRSLSRSPIQLSKPPQQRASSRTKRTKESHLSAARVRFGVDLAYGGKGVRGREGR